MLLYKGKWVQDVNTYHFEGNEGKGIMVKKNISYHELLRVVYRILQLDFYGVFNFNEVCIQW